MKTPVAILLIVTLLSVDCVLSKKSDGFLGNHRKSNMKNIQTKIFSQIKFTICFQLSFENLGNHLCKARKKMCTVCAICYLSRTTIELSMTINRLTKSFWRQQKNRHPKHKTQHFFQICTLDVFFWVHFLFSVIHLADLIFYRWFNFHRICHGSFGTDPETEQKSHGPNRWWADWQIDFGHTNLHRCYV